LNFSATIRTIGRHWLVLVLGLTVVAGGWVLLARKVKPRYKADASVVLLPPTYPLPAGRTPSHFDNPLLLYDARITTVANMTVNSVTDAQTADRLAKAGATGSYSVAAGLGAGAAQVDIETSAPSRAVAMSTILAVEQAISDDLATRQAARTGVAFVPITSRAIAPPNVTTDTKNRSRLLAASAAAGVIAIVMLTFAVEGIGERRRESALARELGYAEAAW